MSDTDPSRKTVWPFTPVVSFTSEHLAMLRGRNPQLLHVMGGSDTKVIITRELFNSLLWQELDAACKSSKLGVIR